MLQRHIKFKFDQNVKIWYSVAIRLSIHSSIKTGNFNLNPCLIMIKKYISSLQYSYIAERTGNIMVLVIYQSVTRLAISAIYAWDHTASAEIQSRSLVTDLKENSVCIICSVHMHLFYVDRRLFCWNKLSLRSVLRHFSSLFQPVSFYSDPGSNGNAKWSKNLGSLLRLFSVTFLYEFPGLKDVKFIRTFFYL